MAAQRTAGGEVCLNTDRTDGIGDAEAQYDR
jgi:hypothetical protein